MHTDSEGAVVATASPQVRGRSPGDAAEPTMPISIPRPGGATHTGLQIRKPSLTEVRALAQGQN